MKLQFGEYCLRSWRKSDAPALVKYANNINIWRNLRDLFPHPYQLTDAEIFINRALTVQPESLFAIATADEAIGSIGLLKKQDIHRFSAEMGYWLAEPFWGQGIMSQAVRLFSDYAFVNFNLIRIFAEPFATNQASARVLEKAGFVLEGRIVSGAVKEGRIVDQLLYARTITPEGPLS
ncbi:MAG: GNAT family N-acetyltransferase [Candidatus Neomarinimicrobiota bacterium]